MPDIPNSHQEFVRPKIARSVADQMEAAFPGFSYERAIKGLLAAHGKATMDPVSAAQTELWIKMDRLEEILSLLALTNIDLADQYRRMVTGELTRVRTASVRLAQAAKNKTTSTPLSHE